MVWNVKKTEKKNLTPLPQNDPSLWDLELFWTFVFPFSAGKNS